MKRHRLLVLSACAVAAPIIAACVGDDAVTQQPVDASDGAPDGAFSDTSLSSDTSPGNDGPTSDASISDGAVSDGDASTFDPRTVGGLKLWLQSGPDFTIVASTATWLDKSGLDNHVTNTAIGCSAPTQVSSPATVVFNGANQCLGVASSLGIAAGAPRTFVVVGKYDAIPGSSNASFFFSQSNAADTQNGPNQYAFEATKTSLTGAGGDRYGAYLTANRYYVQAPVLQTTSFAVHTLVFTAITAGTALPGAVKYRYNGVETTLTIASVSGNGVAGAAPSPSETDLASVVTASGRLYGAAQIREVLVFDSALASAKLDAVELSLKSRYGL